MTHAKVFWLKSNNKTRHSSSLWEPLLLIPEFVPPYGDHFFVFVPALFSFFRFSSFFNLLFLLYIVMRILLFRLGNAVFMWVVSESCSLTDEYFTSSGKKEQVDKLVHGKSINIFVRNVIFRNALHSFNT